MTIAELRQQRKLTQKELADMMGVHVVTISRWETGSRKPSTMAVYALTKALKCDQNEITLKK